MNRIGIRREDKSKWEARVPLVPDDVRKLAGESGLRFSVQSSATRAFSEDQYRAAGADLNDDLSQCPIIMGVKEIPPDKLEAGKTYMYFSHTIKGQAANMPALRQLMNLGCQLIDYERIADDKGRRAVFFGRFAGLAGMIDSLWALGRRLRYEGIDTPFAGLKPAHAYKTLDRAEQAIIRAGDDIKENGLPDAMGPFVCGFAGDGQVSKGAQEIYDLLPVREVAPADLPSLTFDAKSCLKVVFREEHLVRTRDDAAAFDLQEYYDHPDRYQADFIRHVPYLTILMNCIYWERKYPCLITRSQFQDLYAAPRPARLRVIGDITCDIDGSLACTIRTTDPGNPVYVYDPQDGTATDGIEGDGPVVLAIDFLP
ncbi:MAG: hypothetical protein IH987_01120, partial [Planctomycetes bacterium]|nr:hypothetical protein [Planctomycetota bacterium]